MARTRFGIVPQQSSGIIRHGIHSISSKYAPISEALHFALVPELGPLYDVQDLSRRGTIHAGTVLNVQRGAGKWGHRHTGTGSRTIMGLMDNIVPLKNVTICLGYRKTDATLRNSGVFGSSGTTVSKYCNVNAPWGDGVVYWEFGGNVQGTSDCRTSTHGTGAPIQSGGNDWAFTSGHRGMEIWQNGIILAKHSGSIARTADAALNMTFGFHNAFGSDLADYRYFMVFNRVLAYDEIELMGKRPMGLFEPNTQTVFRVTDVSRSLSDDISVTDEVARVLEAIRSETDSLGISDQATHIGDFPRTISQDVGITDQAVGVSDLTESVVDTLGITDLGEGTLDNVTTETLSDTIVFSDEATHNFLIETITDPISFVSTGSSVTVDTDLKFIVVVDGKLQRQPADETIRSRGDINMMGYEINSPYEVYQRVKRLSVATSTVLTDETLILVNATSGNVTLTLPAAADFVDRVIVAKKTDASGNSLILDGDGSETIDGSTTQSTTTQYDIIRVISDGAVWWTLGA